MESNFNVGIDKLLNKVSHGREMSWNFTGDLAVSNTYGSTSPTTFGEGTAHHQKASLVAVFPEQPVGEMGDHRNNHLLLEVCCGKPSDL